ncbi:MAG TPA: hypothetical protein VFS66_03485 [Acidimicrobiia bacterium]|nr:hypothetical protein [Acidimicrobiia bacterium]
MIELNPVPQATAFVRGVRSRVASLFDRKTLRRDAMAGVVLGVESVPDGLAGGLHLGQVVGKDGESGMGRRRKLGRDEPGGR